MGCPDEHRWLRRVLGHALVPLIGGLLSTHTSSAAYKLLHCPLNPPNSGGKLESKSPIIGGFRGRTALKDSIGNWCVLSSPKLGEACPKLVEGGWGLNCKSDLFSLCQSGLYLLPPTFVSNCENLTQMFENATGDRFGNAALEGAIAQTGCIFRASYKAHFN